MKHGIFTILTCLCLFALGEENCALKIGDLQFAQPPGAAEAFIGDIDGVNIYGRVVGVRGLMVEIAGPIYAMSVGARIVIDTGDNRLIPCEVVGFSGSNAVVMPFDRLDGVRRGCRAECVAECATHFPHCGACAQVRAGPG